jgi:hypothetical protein
MWLPLELVGLDFLCDSFPNKDEADERGVG